MFGQVCGKTLGTLFQGEKFFKTMRNIAYASGITAFTMLGFDVASLTAGAFNRDSPLYQFNKYLHKSDVYSGFQFFVTTVAVFTGGFARATKDCIPSESGKKT
ncbi:MAG: hypothetical protein PUC65_01295 [Clostridiales bacterium]|nr:hypothetical protein [Clostridiales bacterium]